MSNLIHSYVLFQRNTALFFIEVKQRIWKEQNRKNMELNIEFLYLTMFTLEKFSYSILKEVEKILKNPEIFLKILGLKNNKDQININQEMKLIKKEIGYHKQSFQVLLEKTKMYISHYLESNYENKAYRDNLRSFLKLIHPELENLTNLEVCLKFVANSIIEESKKNIVKFPSSTLLLIRYLQILLKRDVYFKFNPEEKKNIDFYQFYEDLEEKSNAELIYLIKSETV